MSAAVLEKLSLDKSSGIIVCEKRGRYADDRYADTSSLVYIESGRVEAYDEGGVLISVLEAGDIYGIANLYSGESLPARLLCAEDSVLVFFSKEKVKEVLSANPEAMENYCAILNGKISFLLSRIATLSASTAREKVARYLLCPPEVEFSSRDQLASYLGIARSALFRELKFFEENDCIRSDGGSITLLSADRIRSLI